MDYRELTRDLILLLRNEREAAAQLAINVRELEQRLANAEASAAETMYAADEAASRASWAIRRAEWNAENAEQRAEDERSRLASDLRSATADLERARQWSDEMAEQHALSRLKRLG